MLLIMKLQELFGWIALGGFGRRHYFGYSTLLNSQFNYFISCNQDEHEIKDVFLNLQRYSSLIFFDKVKLCYQGVAVNLHEFKRFVAEYRVTRMMPRN